VHTKQQMSALWLAIRCLLIVTAAENIKGPTLIVHYVTVGSIPLITPGTYSEQ